jgi:hypothetical protein
MRRYLSVLSFMLLSAGSVPVLAAEPATPDASEVEQARERFRRGAELFSEASFDAALAEFKRAYQLVPNYRVLFNIGQVELELHDYVSAERAFGEYLSHGGADVPVERRAEVEKQLEVLRTRIGEVTLEGNLDGAELSVDRTPVGRLPLARPIRVNAGTRLLSLQKPGYARAERSISVAGGDRLNVAVTLEPIASPAAQKSPPTPPPKPVAESSGGPSTGVWIGVAATALFAGSAATFGVLTQRENNALDDALDRYPADPQQVDDTRDKVKLYAALTDVSAGAALVSGLVTLYFALSTDSAEASEKGSSRSVSVHAGLAAGHGSVSVVGAF